MIVVENILADIFSQLPQIKGVDVKFGWGSQDTLNLYLSQIKTTNKYPLIWLVESEETVTQTEVSRPLKLILATNSRHTTNTNPVIWETEFKEVLNPLLENVVKALERSQATFFVKQGDVKYRVNRLSNYSEYERTVNGTTQSKTKTIDNWNVITLNATINFNGNCIATINFN